MRKGWTETSLGEIATLTMGRTPSRSDKAYWTEDLAYPFCTIADMDGKFIFPKREGVTIKAIQEGKAKIAPTGTLLMSFKLTIGRMGFAGQDIFPNEAIVSITPDSAIALDMFLYYLLGFQDLTAGSGRAIKGETLNSKSLSAIPISLPPLAEQKRIVDVVSSVDTYIDALQKQADSARNTRDAVLHDLLSAGGDDWTETTLGAVSKCAGGTAFPHKFQGGEVGIPFVKVSDMNEIGNERFLMSANNYVTEDVLKKLGARVWPKGTVVFAKVGAALLTEKRRILSTETVFDNNIMGLVPSELIDSLFLYLYMETIKLGDFVQPGAVPSVNNKIVSDISIFLPPLSEQKQIVEIVTAMDELIQSTKQAVVDAKTLRSGLLSDLLSGNHEIPASYDSLLGAA